MSALEATQAAASGLLQGHPEAAVITMPLSDGGEGLVDCIARAIEVQWVEADVHDPLMRPLRVRYALSADGTTAYMEMAMAAGLTLLAEDERNPLIASTYGVGEMLLDAVRRGCLRVVMGIGGSATCDGGEGMVEAIRTFLPLPLQVTVASDVQNPLCGANGAAYVFAPQKGATAEQLPMLDQRLRDFALRTQALGFDTDHLDERPGAGAAGGLGYALMAYLGAELRSGIDLVLDVIGFDRALRGASLVLTGEGRSDSQTLMGKVPMGVLRRARAQGVPVVLLSGAVEQADQLLSAGFASVLSINAGDSRPIHELMRQDVAAHNMQRTCAALALSLHERPVQKISVDGGFTCPNRDGSKGVGGCTFCCPEAFVPSYCREAKGIRAQVEAGIRFFAHKHRGPVDYHVYFQAYSGTYASVEVLRQRYEEALSVPGVTGIVIGTRPDCVNRSVLELLSDLQRRCYVKVEYGIESCYDRTLQLVGRGHDFQCTADAIRLTADYGIPIGVHLILGLPGETRDEMLAEADILSALPIQSVKLHQLQIMRGTAMGEEWLQHPEHFALFDVKEYARLVADFARRLNPDIVLERVAASAPSSVVLAPRWGLKPQEVGRIFNEELGMRN